MCIRNERYDWLLSRFEIHLLGFVMDWCYTVFYLLSKTIYVGLYSRTEQVFGWALQEEIKKVR